MSNKKYIITAEIAEYNSYRMDVMAPDIAFANDIIMKFNKSVVNVDVSISLLSVGSCECSTKSPSNIDLNLLGVEQLKEKIYEPITTQSIYRLKDQSSNLKFKYIIQIAEYNRYKITVHTQADLDYAIALVKSNKSKITENYHVELIEVASQEKKQFSEPVLILDSL